MAKRIRRSPGGVTLLILFGFGLFAGGCGSKSLNSSWLREDATLHGKPDWSSLPAERWKNFPGALSIANDSSAFYIHWTAQDPFLSMRLAHTGMTLWMIDPEDETQRLGIRYPLGSDDETARAGHFLPNAELSPEVMSGLLSFQTDEFEVLLGSREDSTARRGEEAEQIGARVLIAERADGGLEYDLKFTFGAAVPWLKAGARVRLELEAPAMEQEKPDRRKGHRGGPGAGGRGHGPASPPGRGGDRPAGVSPFRPIHFMTMVQLSAGPALGTADK